MSLIRGWRRQNRDALTFNSKRGVSSFVAQTAAEAKAAAGAWTPNRVFRIAYRLALWAIRRSKKYTDSKLTGGSTAASGFYVTTDSSFQTFDANESIPLFFTGKRYAEGSGVGGGLTWGDSSTAEFVAPDAGLWHHSINLHLQTSVYTSGIPRIRLFMQVYRGGILYEDLLDEIKIFDSVNSEETAPGSGVYFTNYMFVGSGDYAAQAGDIFVPVIEIVGLPGGKEISVERGFWCAHRCGDL